MEESITIFVCCKDCNTVTRTVIPLSMSLLEVNCPKCGSGNVILRGEQAPKNDSASIMHHMDKARGDMKTPRR